MEKEAIIVGGEESGGLSVKGHVPEKDGILACLLMAELMAAEKKPLGAVLKDVGKITGPFFTDRINIHIDPAQKEKLLTKLAAGAKNIGEFPVQKFVTIDGFKFVLPDDEWIAFRASGTEPVFRCYIEAHSKSILPRSKRSRERVAEVSLHRSQVQSKQFSSSHFGAVQERGIVHLAIKFDREE